MPTKSAKTGDASRGGTALSKVAAKFAVPKLLGRGTDPSDVKGQRTPLVTSYLSLTGELKPNLLFPACAPRSLVDIYFAICACELGPAPDLAVAILKIADPRRIASVIELLGMDTNYMPHVWAKLASLKVIEPIHLDSETERRLELLEGEHVNRKSMLPNDVTLYALVATCAKIQSL